MISRSVPQRPTRSVFPSSCPSPGVAGARRTSWTSPGLSTTRAWSPAAGPASAVVIVAVPACLLIPRRQRRRSCSRLDCPFPFRVADPAERGRDPVGGAAHRPAQLVHPPGREVAFDPGHAHGPGTSPVVAEEHRANAEDALGVFLIVHGETLAAGHRQ